MGVVAITGMRLKRSGMRSQRLFVVVAGGVVEVVMGVGSRSPNWSRRNWRPSSLEGLAGSVLVVVLVVVVSVESSLNGSER
jgi:hypothetical protein